MSDTPETAPTPDAPRPSLRLAKDAPDLTGAGKECPNCSAKAPADAVLCVQCGYNFKTGKKMEPEDQPGKKRMILLGTVGGILLVGALAFLFWPSGDEDFIPPVITHTDSDSNAAEAARQAKLEKKKAEEEARAKAEADKKASADAEKAARLVAEQEAALQAQAEAEIAARAAEEAAAAEAEAQRQAFEAKKAQALETFRARLDQTEPMYKAGDTVELRQKNGFVKKGILKRYGIRDDVRIVVLETELTGTVEIPIQNLDPATRRRCDDEYRTAYIQHFIDTKASQMQAAQPAE